MFGRLSQSGQLLGRSFSLDDLVLGTSEPRNSSGIRRYCVLSDSLRRSIVDDGLVVAAFLIRQSEDKDLFVTNSIESSLIDSYAPKAVVPAAT